MKRIVLHISFLAITTLSSFAYAQEEPIPAASAEELAKKLSNPVASLTSSVPGWNRFIAFLSTK